MEWLLVLVSLLADRALTVGQAILEIREWTVVGVAMANADGFCTVDGGRENGGLSVASDCKCELRISRSDVIVVTELQGLPKGGVCEGGYLNNWGRARTSCNN